MDSEVLTLVALGVVVAGGWLIELFSHPAPTALEREMSDRIKKSVETIRGAPLP
jgi:hypothetical protein